MTDKKIDRKKFTTTLSMNTIRELEEIKVYINKINNIRIRGLNEVIEIIVKEKWGEIYNGEDNKKK